MGCDLRRRWDVQTRVTPYASHLKMEGQDRTFVKSA